MIDNDTVSSDILAIEAPAQLVWDVLVDFENYHLWNEFCPQVDAKLELGQPVTMQIDLGNSPQVQVEYLTRIDPPHTIIWSMVNRPGDPIHADRIQRITPIDETSCTYVSIDEFGGEAMGPMIEAMGAAVEAGFNLCARGLKQRAETLYAHQKLTAST